ncbi:unnamed protein product, partial [Polarella glacialis]
MQLIQSCKEMELETEAREQQALKQFLGELFEHTVRPLRFLEPGGTLLWKPTVGSQIHKRVSFVKAMMSAASAAMPICRQHAACVVEQASMFFWRLIVADESQFRSESGVAQEFFEYIRTYLPPTAQWSTPLQCPLILYPNLEARPIWGLSDLPEGSAALRLAVALRAGAEEIREDLQSGILSTQGLAMIRDPAWTGLHHDGGWKAFTVYRTAGLFGRMKVPRELDPMHCRIAHRTCRLLREAGVPPGMTQKLPSLQGSQEVIDFLSADPGVVVNFHTASVNTRLTVQICLSGCNDGETGGSYIQVGTERHYYRFGDPVVFDDSFLHSVYIDPKSNGPRWVLSVQLMHPRIDTREKFVKHFADHETPVFDMRNDDPAGPPPLAFLDSQELRRTHGVVPAGQSSFVLRLDASVLLYSAVWGPTEDGPPELVGEASP